MICIFGSTWSDYFKPKYFDPEKMLKKEDNELKIKNVCIGDNFTIIQDNDNYVFCWRSDYLKEIKNSK